MTAEATVTRIGENGNIEVEFAPPARCGGCEGACFWRSLPGPQRLNLKTRLALSVGERVEVAVPDGYLLLGAIFVHGLPLFALLIGATLGFAIGGSDATAVLGAVLALGAALLSAPWLRARVERETLSRVELRAGARRAHVRSL